MTLVSSYLIDPDIIIIFKIILIKEEIYLVIYKYKMAQRPKSIMEMFDEDIDELNLEDEEEFQQLDYQ
jgi:hypothetical protein